ncbi:MAG: DUF3048 domain-containing protein [Firmicutes bacterium]|nr:DUF3048 domain-containing protein [Bacillota bacterium]
MKRILAILLVLCMLLCGCGSDEEEVTEATQSEATEESSKVKVKEEKKVESKAEESSIVEEKEVFRHPLTGEVLEEPWKGVAAASTINNAPDALPQYGISQADVFYEIEVEGGITRMLAVFTDMEEVGSIGPVRSARSYFNNITAAYNIPLFHCGGSTYGANGYYDSANVLPEWRHVNEMEYPQYFFRDSDRYNYQGYAWEHTLFTTGEEMAAALTDKGYDVREVYDFGLSFAEKPEFNGESATEVEIIFEGGKTYSLTYNAGTGRYEGAEYGGEHIDGATGEVMSFRNVLALYTAQYHGEGGLSFYDLIGSGNGHFACDGKIIPIKWSRSDIYEPFVYTLEDGTPLTLGVGNSYIAIISDVRTVEYN